MALHLSLTGIRFQIFALVATNVKNNNLPRYVVSNGIRTLTTCFVREQRRVREYKSSIRLSRLNSRHLFLLEFFVCASVVNVCCGGGRR